MQTLHAQCKLHNTHTYVCTCNGLCVNGYIVIDRVFCTLGNRVIFINYYLLLMLLLLYYDDDVIWGVLRVTSCF